MIMSGADGVSTVVNPGHMATADAAAARELSLGVSANLATIAEQASEVLVQGLHPHAL
jgi:hypothetical protein